jgi:hypothetical protein
MLGSDPIQADDWLVHAPLQAPAVAHGTLGGVPTLTLSNGLISRVFALPAPTTALGDAAGSEVCPNPGGRLITRPDGSTYPYYGLSCVAETDCGQCASEGKCQCCPYTADVNPKCCKPTANCTTPPRPSINVTGFATVGLSRVGHAGREADTGAQLLRASSPEATVRLDGVRYDVGGLDGQVDLAFLNASLLADLRPKAGFHYQAHRTASTTTARYEWTPGDRHSDATLAWPPLGLTLEVDFAAPASAPAAHQSVTITVVYEIFTGVPAYSKWVRVTNAEGATAVVVDELSTELLYATNEAMGYWAHPTAGLLTAGSTSGRIHLQSEMSRGGDTTVLSGDGRCDTCTQGNGLLVLNSSYPLGPGAEVGGESSGAFHGQSFTSFHTYVLVQDSDDTERQGLALRKMYRTLAPQVTENPIFSE